MKEASVARVFNDRMMTLLQSGAGEEFADGGKRLREAFISGAGLEVGGDLVSALFCVAAMFVFCLARLCPLTFGRHRVATWLHAKVRLGPES